MTTILDDLETEIEPQPRFVGFCRGIPGQFHGKRMYDADPDLNLLERGQGVICDECVNELLNIKSWSSASPVLHNANKGRGSGISLPGSTVFKSPRVPGSAKKTN